MYEYAKIRILISVFFIFLIIIINMYGYTKYKLYKIYMVESFKVKSKYGGFYMI